MAINKNTSESQRFAPRDYIDLHDPALIGLLLGAAFVTFPFAFEFCAALIVASRSLRLGLTRSRHIWFAAIIIVLAALVIWDDLFRFVLRYNLFALFSTDEFLVSRHANLIERIGLLLSFSCLLLFARPATLERLADPQFEGGSARKIAMFVVSLGALAIKWNHFVAPLVRHTTPSWAGFSVLDPYPTALIMGPILASVGCVGVLVPMFAVKGIKFTFAKNEGNRG